MVGGKPEIMERVKPLFSCMGKNIVHIGPNGAGQVAKACNQIVMLVALQGLAGVVDRKPRTHRLRPQERTGFGEGL
jgi:3-hydroxyisobutyrate dehydrogenase-like beta-hydroxyacid dehydrogenase